MIDCAVVGDSIALGVGTELHRCVVNATVGIPSTEVIGRVQEANVLVVSAGSNDPRNPKLEANLRAIRARAAQRVIWIAPMDPIAAEAVRRVARIHGDAVVGFTPRPDHIHPRSYPALAGRVATVMRNDP
ncbi:MAG TPA: hypothetical protein VMU08_02320 [Rhizomicrobium sp.]|nr:hypothetical protein [Rhizomicrobium sp.]